MSSPTDSAFEVLEDGECIAYGVGIKLAVEHFDYYLAEARESLRAKDLDINVDNNEHRVFFTAGRTIEHLPGYISETS